MNPTLDALALAKDIGAAGGNEAIPLETRYRLAAQEIDHFTEPLRAEIATLRKALNRVLTLIPRDFNERTGERGIFHDEQPDSPGGFLACDPDEVIEAIISYVEALNRTSDSSANLTVLPKATVDAAREALGAATRYLPYPQFGLVIEECKQALAQLDTAAKISP